jgi:hypothetical protein
MAKPTKKEREKEIVEIIKKNKIMFIEHIFGYYTDIKKSQFYNLKLHESDAIREAIHKNRTFAAGYMIQKWIASDNPTLQVAAYRLVCSSEEHRLLNQQYVESTTTQKVELSGLSEEELNKKIEELERKLS